MMIWSILAALADPISCCGPLLFEDQPVGTVNPVCWKLLGIAASMIGSLVIAVVYMANKIIGLMEARYADLAKINQALLDRKGANS